MSSASTKPGIGRASQNPDANCLSDWCEWDRADWLEAELKLVADHKDPHESYVIKYPLNCQVKPRNKRLGSMSFSGNIVRFIDLPDRDNLAWTPFISATALRSAICGSSQAWPWTAMAGLQ